MTNNAPKIRHDDGSIDQRYSFNREYLGYSVPLIAVRFCGELIGACHDEQKAQHVADEHKIRRFE